MIHNNDDHDNENTDNDNDNSDNSSNTTNDNDSNNNDSNNENDNKNNNDNNDNDDNINDNNNDSSNDKCIMYHICIYVCTYVCVYIYIYIYTHICVPSVWGLSRPTFSTSEKIRVESPEDLLPLSGARSLSADSGGGRVPSETLTRPFTFPVKQNPVPKRRASRVALPGEGSGWLQRDRPREDDRRRGEARVPGGGLESYNNHDKHNDI